MSDTRVPRPYARLLIPLLAALLLAPLAALQAEDQSLRVDLLIVGGNESACAAAVQAARLGVERIALVNDIDWLGGAVQRGRRRACR
jgi:hypothetical protein